LQPLFELCLIGAMNGIDFIYVEFLCIHFVHIFFSFNFMATFR